MGAIEFGVCPICGKETHLERTYFYYPIRCNCCGCKIDGLDCHFEMVVHCKDCPAPMPTEIHPYIKAFDGVAYQVDISNILPIKVRGKFIIEKGIKDGTKTIK